jgi:hypothetical protein
MKCKANNIGEREREISRFKGERAVENRDRTLR